MCWSLSWKQELQRSASQADALEMFELQPDSFYAVSVTSVYTEYHFHTNAAILFCTATSSNWILLIITLIFNIGVFFLVIYLEFKNVTPRASVVDLFSSPCAASEVFSILFEGHQVLALKRFSFCFVK